MDNKITSLIKAILDKTSLTKAFDDLQSFFNRNLLHLRPKIDTNELKSQMQKTEEKQNRSSASPPKPKPADNRGGLIRLYHSFPFLATAGFGSDAYEACR